MHIIPKHWILTLSEWNVSGFDILKYFISIFNKSLFYVEVTLSISKLTYIYKERGF